MKKSKATKIIERVAVSEGITIAEVRANMQEAIDIAYGNRGESNADFWDKWRGRKPTVEEFLVSANGEILRRLGVR
jgi:hypothetical protein